MSLTTRETAAERSARWPGMDVEAIEFLADAGYTLNRDCSWTRPFSDHEPTAREIDAIIYLIDDWDFEGLRGLKTASEAEKIFRLAS